MLKGPSSLDPGPPAPGSQERRVDESCFMGTADLGLKPLPSIRRPTSSSWTVLNLSDLQRNAVNLNGFPSDLTEPDLDSDVVNF